MPLQNLQDYIIVLPNVMPSEVCDRIIAECKDDNGWNIARVDAGKVNQSIRNCKILHITKSSKTELDGMIFNAYSKALQEYKNKFPLIHIKEDTGYDALMYEEGGFYSEHADYCVDEQRAISCSIALNDDFTGGEFGFFSGSIKYTIPKGSAILFPANFMYPHEIFPVKSGVRHSIITWFR